MFSLIFIGLQGGQQFYLLLALYYSAGVWQDEMVLQHCQHEPQRKKAYSTVKETLYSTKQSAKRYRQIMFLERRFSFSSIDLKYVKQKSTDYFNLYHRQMVAGSDSNQGHSNFKSKSATSTSNSISYALQIRVSCILTLLITTVLLQSAFYYLPPIPKST